MKFLLLNCQTITCRKLNGECKQYVHSVNHSTWDANRCTCGCLATNHAQSEVLVHQNPVACGSSIAVTMKAKVEMEAYKKHEKTEADALFVNDGDKKRKRKETPPPTTKPKQNVVNLCDESDDEELEALKVSLFGPSPCSSKAKATPKTATLKSTQSSTSSTASEGPMDVSLNATYWEAPRSGHAMQYAAHVSGAEEGVVGTDADQPRLRLPKGGVFDFRASLAFKPELCRNTPRFCLSCLHNLAHGYRFTCPSCNRSCRSACAGKPDFNDTDESVEKWDVPLVCCVCAELHHQQMDAIYARRDGGTKP